jgi:hypothetical protein
MHSIRKSEFYFFEEDQIDVIAGVSNGAPARGSIHRMSLRRALLSVSRRTAPVHQTQNASKPNIPSSPISRTAAIPRRRGWMGERMGERMTTSIDLVAHERRKTPRRAVSRVVRLELENGMPGTQPVLLITDISDGGARLFAQNIEVPKNFALVFAESGIRRECRMVWQIGPEVGLEFIDRGKATRRGKSGRARRPVAVRVGR